MFEGPDNTKFKRHLFLRFAFICFLAVLFLAFFIITKIPSAAEFFAVTVSQNLIRAFGYITNFLSFSLFEILVIALILLILYVIVSLIVHLVKRNWKRTVSLLTRLVAAALFVLVLYNFTMGFAYYRGAPEFNLPAYTVTDKNAEDAMRSMINELYSLAEEFSDENDVVTSPYSFTQLCEKIAHEYTLLGDYFYDYSPRVKPLKFSFILSYMGFSGIFFGPTAEPNINMLYEDTYYMPHVIAHELAHSKGVNREADAEAVARYLLLSSSDPYLRYCGLLNSYWLMLDALSLVPDYAEFIEARPAALYNEWRRIDDLQDNYTNPLQTLFDIINSWYINKNNQTGGSDEYAPDYGEVVETPVDSENPPKPGDPPPPPVYKYSDIQKMIVLIYFK